MKDTQTAQIRPNGLVLDVNPAELNGSAWALVENMHVRDAYLVGIPQDAPLSTTYTNDILNTPLHIHAEHEQNPSAPTTPGGAPNPAVSYIYATGVDAAGTSGELITILQDRGAVANIDRTPTTWSKPTAGFITSCNINGQVVINNTEDPPVYGAAGGAFTVLPGWLGSGSAVAGSIRAYGRFLIACAVDTTGTSIRSADGDKVYWSDRATTGMPSTWTPLATNEAGDATKGDTPGLFMDSLSLGVEHILYKTHACYRMRQIGLPEVMEIKRLPLSFGVLSRNSILEIGGLHYVLTQGDVVKHNGREAQSIVDGRVRNAIFDAINDSSADPQSNALQSWMAYDRRNEEIIIGINDGSKTYPSRGFIYNLKRDQWSERALGEANLMKSGDGDTGYPHATGKANLGLSNLDYVGAALVAANPDDTTGDERIQWLNRRDEDSPGPMKCEVHTIRLNPTGKAAINKVWLRGDTLKNGTITVGTQDHEDDTITWGTSETFTASGDRYVTVSPVAARFHSIRFETTTGTAKSRVLGFDAEFTPSGEY